MAKYISYSAFFLFHTAAFTSAARCSKVPQPHWPLTLRHSPLALLVSAGSHRLKTKWDA